MYIVFYLIIFSFLLFYYIFINSKNKLNISYEYLFSLCNLVVIFPLLFLSNTICTLFFTLEVISCLIFYKFVVSKFWLNNKLLQHNFKQISKYKSIMPKQHVNTLFFQY